LAKRRKNGEVNKQDLREAGGPQNLKRNWGVLANRGEKEQRKKRDARSSNGLRNRCSPVLCPQTRGELGKERRKIKGKPRLE